jgi:hypothetical protein
MSDLIKKVTPLTRAIIWIAKDERDLSNPHYGQIDYLLDGLLTANLKVSKDVSSRVIVGQSFNHSLYVMVLKEFNSKELDSFISLFKANLLDENDILIVDEVNAFQKIKNDLKTVSANIKLLQ